MATRSFIEGLSAQPDFPHEDLTEANADLIELLIGSSQLCHDLHTTHESMSWVARIGHTSIVHASRDTFEQAQRIDALDYGVQSFEVVKALVVANNNNDSLSINAAARALLGLDGRGYERHVDTAVDQFTTQMPRTRDVVQANARARHGYFTDYAILGMALAWRFEQDAA